MRKQLVSLGLNFALFAGAPALASSAGDCQFESNTANSVSAVVKILESEPTAAGRSGFDIRNDSDSAYREWDDWSN